MPLYEYQCSKCGHLFEKIQKFSDRPIRKCPECGSRVEKTISAPAVQFKGSGWYVTDYAKKSNVPATSSDSGGKDSKESKKEEKKAETPAKDSKKADKSK